MFLKQFGKRNRSRAGRHNINTVHIKICHSRPVILNAPHVVFLVRNKEKNKRVPAIDLESGLYRKTDWHFRNHKRVTKYFAKSGNVHTNSPGSSIRKT